MFEDTIKNAKNDYLNLLGESEEDIKNQVVIPFLLNLGYHKEWFKYEYPTFNGYRRVDISIWINKNPSNLFFIEVKKKNHELNSNDCTQLANYLNDKHIEWGILTNGNEFILLNNSVRGESSKKDVLRYYLFEPKEKDSNYPKSKNKNNLKYFSFNYLFKLKATNYFKFLKDYKIQITNLNSYKQYESVLYNYFDYLSEQNITFDIANIRPNTFKNYLLDLINKQKLSDSSKYIKKIETVVSKYAYIRGFYASVLEPIEKHNPFKNVNEKDLMDDIKLQVSNRNSTIEPLTEKEILLILNSYDNTRAALRNKIIFLLFLFTGLSNEEIRSIRNKDIELEFIKINNKRIPIPKELGEMLLQYFESLKDKKIKCEYLVSGRYGKSYSKLDASIFHNIISKQFDKIDDISDERKKVLTPSFIKWSIVKIMFKNGSHIEDIVKYTGLSLTALSEYLSIDDIYTHKTSQNYIRKHPYINILVHVNI